MVLEFRAGSLRAAGQSHVGHGQLATTGYLGLDRVRAPVLLRLGPPTAAPPPSLLEGGPVVFPITTCLLFAGDLHLRMVHQYKRRLR